jgi:diguanylate cyclase (GGDEF)-like protein
MEIHSKPNKDQQPEVKKKSVFDILMEHEKTSSLLKEDADKKPVSIIVLCDSPDPFDMKILEATPHIALDMEDDLLLKISELQEENARLQSLSLIDSLTSLYNNRFFWSQLEIEMARTKRTGNICSLMMIDLDNFKVLNDTLGHIEGDRFLVKFGSIIRENARSTDLIYRYGGDEFVVIMPDTSASDAFKTGERFRKRLEEMPQKTTPAVSLSIGISEYSHYFSYDMYEFVHAADLAMYEAKKGGKNRICMAKGLELPRAKTSEVNPDEKESLLKEYK